MHISIGQASVMIGVSISTLRRWEIERRFSSKFRTKGGHRRYSLQDIEKEFLKTKVKNNRRKNVIYARVSSSEQKSDLTRQILVLKQYCKKMKLPYFLISDLGSGLNYNKRGLNQLIEAICTDQVDRLILTHRDRLLRFGSPLLFKLCDFHNTEVVVLNDKKSQSFEEEIVRDIVEIMTVYCAKIHGRRSHAHRMKLKQAS